MAGRRWTDRFYGGGEVGGGGGEGGTWLKSRLAVSERLSRGLHSPLCTIDASKLRSVVAEWLRHYGDRRLDSSPRGVV